MIELTPTEGELHLAGSVGVLRAIYALRTNRDPRMEHLDKSCMMQHIFGAIGEAMLARHTGIYWAGTVGTISAVADVGKCYQVRATDLLYGKLIVHPDDIDDQPFVLARVVLPKVFLVGWLWGHEAKAEKFWREDVPKPAFFAWPLHDMAALPDQAAVKALQSSLAR